MIDLTWGTRYDDFIAEAWPLIRAHWNEVGSHRDVLRLDPDHERYRALEKVGALHILTARLDGKIIGYMFVLVTRHPRDRGAIAATDDVIYAAPQYRRHHVGAKMLREALRRVEELGVNIVFFREKAWRHGGGYLERYRFHKQEMVYAKVLKPPHAQEDAA